MTTTPKPGAPPGNTNAAKPPEERARRHTIRLYRRHEEAIEALIKAGYASNKQAVIRRALDEAVERAKKGV